MSNTNNKKAPPFTRRAIRPLTAALITALLLSLLCAPLTASASPTPTPPPEPVTVQVRVTQAFTSTGGGSPSGVFTYSLTPIDAQGNPLPAGSAPLPTGPGAVTNGVYQFTLNGNGATEDITIEFTSAGSYAYRLSCTTGARSYYTLDTRVYRIEVTVIENKDTNSLGAGTVAYRENSDPKEGKTIPAYSHSYTYTYTPPPVTPPPVTPTTPEQTPTEEPTESPTDAPSPTPTPGQPTPTPEPPPVPLDDNGAPLGEWVWDEDEGAWILDEYPPLGDIAKTGDTMRLTLYITTASASILALLILWATRRRKTIN